MKAPKAPCAQATSRKDKEDDTDYIWEESTEHTAVQTHTALVDMVKNEVNRWFKMKPTKDNPSHHLFSQEFTDSWAVIFLEYNTPLPSSSSDILRPKRSSLTSHDFKQLVFIKGNIGIIKKNHELQEEEVE